MALRTIRYSDDEILRKNCREVKVFDEKLFTLLGDMTETMYKADGVGLAAPQVGILKKIAVIDVEDDNGIIELINPEILETRGLQVKSEACLSVPGKSGKVERPEYIKVKALDRNGEPFEIEGEGFLAVALSHEIDHLSGVLYTDKVVEFDPEEDDEFDEDEEFEELAEGVEY